MQKFFSARIKLTLWYLLIIMTISGFFSILVYRLLTRELSQFVENQQVRIERRFRENPRFTNVTDLPIHQLVVDLELVNQVRRRILLQLLIMDAGIFVLVGGLSFILAGRTLKPIHEMVVEQRRFVSDASHELKTPLTSLKSGFEVHLRNPKRTSRQADQLISESIEEVDKLQQLSDSLLQPANITGQTRLQVFGPVDISELISGAIKRVNSLAKAKKITIKTQKIVAKPYFISGDQAALEKLLVILLDNAIKYGPSRSKVALNVKLFRSKVLIAVTDQGPGIVPADRAKIFDRFFRADVARSDSSKNGYGLGLAIADKIVKDHGGTIGVTCDQSKGSTFMVTLPVTKKTA